MLVTISNPHPITLTCISYPQSVTNEGACLNFFFHCFHFGIRILSFSKSLGVHQGCVGDGGCLVPIWIS
jgi:hypothetical protein